MMNAKEIKDRLPLSLLWLLPVQPVRNEECVWC